MYRQGDVLIIPVPEIPKNVEKVPRDAGRVVLAYGEVTGHAHAIVAEKATMFRDPKLNALFMNVTGKDPVALQHEEHSTINIAPGKYQVIRQREYTPQAVKYVAD